MHTTVLNEEDWERFIKALNDPKEMNDRMKKTMELYYASIVEPYNPETERTVGVLRLPIRDRSNRKMA